MAYRQINVRSPFYVEKTTTEPIIQLNVRIWQYQLVANRPTEATYVLEKETDKVSNKAVFER